MGCCLEDLAPTVAAAVPSRIHKEHTVADALQEHVWPADIRGGSQWWASLNSFIYGIFYMR
jgi:hypothetical protein